MISGNRLLRLALYTSIAPTFLGINPAAAQVPAGISGGPPTAGAAGNEVKTSGPFSAPYRIQTVVISARKKSENVQKVPAQVDVVGRRTLEDLHVTQLSDISGYIPGMQVNSAGAPGQTTISLRGIAPIGPAPTVGTYIDDAPVGATSINAEGSLHSLDLLPYDLQNIEVLQGPQGTLYGANSIGGLIKYELTAPSLTTYNGNVGFDTFGVQNAGDAGGGGHASLSGPLVANKLGFLASYGSESTPGYIDNAQTGQKDQNGIRQQTGRFSLLWDPSTDISVKFNALFQEVYAAGQGTVALDPTALSPVNGALSDNNYLAQPSRNTLDFYSVDVNWNLHWATLVSTTSYSSTKFTQVQDNTRAYDLIFPLLGLPLGVVPFDFDLATRKETQEIRLTSPGAQRVEWLIGGFYTHEYTVDDQDFYALTDSGQPVAPVNPLLVAELPDTYSEFAGFGDLTYHFTDQFDIAGGLRFSHNSQTFPVTSSGFLTGNASLYGKSAESVVTYSVAPRYQITNNILSYIRVASGYQAGGPNIPYPGVPATVKSDTLTNYEAGLKTEFWDQRALLDIAAFYINWKNIQIQAFQQGTGFTYLDNGGTAKSEGISANTVVHPIDGLSLAANLTYTNAVLTQNAPQIEGRSGDQLPFIPTCSGAAQAGYDWLPADDLEAHVGIGLRGVGDRFSSVQSSPDAYRLNAYEAVDLDASLTYGRYTARLFVKNATNSRGYDDYTLITDALTGANSQIEGTVIQPLTIGIAIDANF
jgi:iron complex outermembrane receptor protein